ncbi:MAG: YeeE/YedE family protein [Rhodospirillum sp.]|nr:YeeE/YedE family protein [Rhodospirillum sp.]MCF8488890.1 YeeE/YedE family protein [Rhodospirillum sp.]MCF8500048.1 YeeE/YedE family protein [Rhodospirillum sp.]
MSPSVRPYWPPLAAGFALGLALLVTFLITGHGLGASGFFTRVAAALSGWLAPVWAQANGYFGPFLQANPLAAWISWEIVGVLIGGILGAVSSGRFKAMVERGPRASSLNRLLMAFAGGALAGIGARFARGCTSGLGLSGGATLAVAGFLFLIGFFVAGFIASYFLKKAWT